MFEQLDALIALIFIYLLLSLMVTSLMELTTQIEGLRGKILCRSIGRLLVVEGDRKTSAELLKRFYQHPRILQLQGDNRALPSYIPDELFKQVLLESLTGRPWSELRHRPYQLEQALLALGHLQVGKTLLQIWEESEGRVPAFWAGVGQWFADTQSRASGWFQRSVRIRLLLLGLLVAIAANANTLQMFQRMLEDDSLRALYVNSALQFDQSRYQQLGSQLEGGGDAVVIPPSSAERLQQIKLAASEVVPVLGWENAPPITWKSLIGWLLTAIALSLGAPFWFDLLQKVARMRTSLRPVPPKESATEERGEEAGERDLTSATAVELEAFSHFQPQQTHPDPLHALWMARFADLAYRDEQEIASRCQEWGLEYEFYAVGGSAWNDTQYLLAYNHQTLILAFRGSEPGNVSDLLTSARLPLTPALWNRSLRVHTGFQEALNAAWDAQLKERLAQLHHNRYLWISGHNLGAALAVLAASRIAHLAASSRPLLRGLYTIGQPRVGDRAFAEDLERRLGNYYCRVVNHRDPIPVLPPPLHFTHAGSVFYLNESGRLLIDPPLWYRALDRIDYSNDRQRLQQHLRESLGDHASTRYLTLLHSAAAQQQR